MTNNRNKGEGKNSSGETGFMTFGPADEKARRAHMAQMVRTAPIPDNELLYNTGLFLTPQTLSRVLFMDFLYRQGLDIQGIVVEFGCRWGQNTSLFTALRGIYEPFNRLRKVIGFDTFEGFVSVAAEDNPNLKAGDYSTTKNYELFLTEWLKQQEAESPLPHLEKFEILKGDVRKTLPAYLERNQQTVISLAYFDLDLYEATRDSLMAIKPYLTKGSIIGFDEVNDITTPGETTALKEVFGLGNYSIKRFLPSARTSYLVIE